MKPLCMCDYSNASSFMGFHHIIHGAFLSLLLYLLVYYFLSLIFIYVYLLTDLLICFKHFNNKVVNLEQQTGSLLAESGSPG